MSYVSFLTLSMSEVADYGCCKHVIVKPTPQAKRETNRYRRSIHIGTTWYTKCALRNQRMTMTNYGATSLLDTERRRINIVALCACRPIVIPPLHYIAALLQYLYIHINVIPHSNFPIHRFICISFFFTINVFIYTLKGGE